MTLTLVGLTVFNRSPFIGKALGEIVKEYNVNIPHYSNPSLYPLNPLKKIKYSPDIKIKEFFIIYATGLEKNLYRLLEGSA